MGFEQATFCFGNMPSSHRSLKGQLLLDGGKLQGSFFHRTVLLVCQHDPNGAFGLVLNKSSDRPASELIHEDLPDSIRDNAVFLGGPVQASALTFLHSREGVPDTNVIAGVQMGHSLEEMIEIGQAAANARTLRIFAGYSGWSALQLDDEMKRGAWLTHPASTELIFETDPGQLWKKVLRTKGWRYTLLADSPEDASVN